MESYNCSGSVKKRKIVEDDELFRFKILLPNGDSVSLKLLNPGPKMPYDEFIKLVHEECVRVNRSSKPSKNKRRINWKDISSLVMLDANDAKIGSILNLKGFKPHKCHILRLYDGGSENVDTYENMWDLTPDTDLLMELPEEYTFETALADLIDNSLQAVWSNARSDQRVIKVVVLDDRISIFDSGPGMDGSDGIVKWGKMGASLHRSSKQQAIGGKPPYLKPYFGMFGYGGPVASMHLGSRTVVSSKTKDSKKVYWLQLEREALLKNAGSDLSWKTCGGIRAPSKDEVESAPHGSFTKVEIFEPKMKNLDVRQIQCWLKDIYFPYIQCDEVSETGKTITPVKFQVNGTDLAEIEGGEIATTNMHSSNGPDFILRIHFLAANATDSRSPKEANIRVRCVYFPILEGKESIEKILEKLKTDGNNISKQFENFSRVSVRRLGRLLPDTRWAWLPFMDLSHKKGTDKSNLLKRCCLRVKCFIDTDGGINPTPSKTDLAPQNPFTIALKNFGKNVHENEKGIEIKVYRDDKLVSLVQLEKQYQEWILLMNMKYDEEGVRGEDPPVIVVSPAKGKGCFKTHVGRFHEVIRRKGERWESGQRVKLLKGACAGVHKNNVYATLEYFLLEGFEDAGGESKIICRPINIPDEQGCILSATNGEPSFDLRKSMSVPLSVIDSGKCLHLESTEWENQVDKRRQKSPSSIDLLSSKQCKELKVDGEDLLTSIIAGEAPPKEFVAVVRPSNYASESDPKDLVQKHIFKSETEMLLEVKFNNGNKANKDHVYSKRVAPSQLNGFQGLYVFPFGHKFPNMFQKVGEYTFSFTLVDSSCESLVKKVEVKASPKIGKWKLAARNQSRRCSMRVGLPHKCIFVECFDIYDNWTPFTTKPSVKVTLQAQKGANLRVKSFKAVLSKSNLLLENLLVESTDLDKNRPAYEATLIISSSNELFSVTIPCIVTPGRIEVVKPQPSIIANQLLPGYIVKELELKMFDAFGNMAMKGSKVVIKLKGFQLLDKLGLEREVDDQGCVDLSGVLKVTAVYGENVSLSISSSRVIFKQEFQIEKRELRLKSEVPESLTAGSLLGDMIFEVVSPDGCIDETINDEEKFGQSHMLTLKADWLKTEESIRYTFKNGRCTIPSIPLPQAEGRFSFVASHSRHSSLSLTVKVHLRKPLKTPKRDRDESTSMHSGGNIVLHQNPNPLAEVGKKFVMTTEINIKEREQEMIEIALQIGTLEKKEAMLLEHKEEVDRSLKELQDSSEPCVLGFPNCFTTKEEVTEQIEKRGNSAAAVLCKKSTRLTKEPENEAFRDVLGVVAVLGRVHSLQLSKALSAYLGLDQMLAIVTRSVESAFALEKYQENGQVDYSHALYAEAAKLGKPITSQFLVICLEDISPFDGDFEDDCQRRLVLRAPRQSCGSMPSGFLGFAVNMIDFDEEHLSIKTESGKGLRETMFYRLFGRLQVYSTRAEMLAARGYIKCGAVSLDGGILRENGIVSLGPGGAEICFQVVAMGRETPDSQENMKKMELVKSECKKTNDALVVVIQDLEERKKIFDSIKEEYEKLVNSLVPILGSQEIVIL